ncbi:FRE family ferric-chelate reductase [Aspergillus ambiguus]|uniref:FRE family ferric-chelate reductase n=1 Tax=Aspergillus ambiguus TaxID=176160 RepID=UPI003CCD5B29
MQSILWLCLSLYSLGTAASVLPPNQRCVTAIYTAYGYIRFSGTPAKGSWNTRCQNPLEVTSIYAASDVYCSVSQRHAGLSQLEAFCREYAGSELIPREQLAENLTDDAVRNMRVVDFGELSRKRPVDTPVLISAVYYDITFRTIDSWQFETWSHYAYGYAGYAFWASILTIGMLHRLVRHIVESRKARADTRPRYSLTRALFTNIYSWVQTHILISPPIPSQGRQVLWWTFPTRAEALVVLVFWFLSITFCAVDYRAFPGNLYWPNTSDQIIRYVADRTGILSFANFPLIWLFSGRNNIFLWATGWSFATFNIFHRHIAWIATIQGLLHTILYLAMFIQNGNAWRKLQKPYLFWGTIGMVAMFLLLPLAMDFFRRRNYESFLVLHILLSIATLIGCFYHTIIFEGQEYWFYLWPAVAIWAFDRVLRLIRIIYCNLHVNLALGKGIYFTRSTATYDKMADVIRLDICPGSLNFHPKPGQYYYLYQPFRFTGWESHPFTLGSWTYEGAEISYRNSRGRKDDRRVDVSQIPLLSDSSSGVSRSVTFPSQDDPRAPNFVFWIRPFDGWTRHLQEQCMRSPDRRLQMALLLEGPYGEPFPLSNYESILLVAGGTGIAAAVPYIQDYLAEISQKSESKHPLTRDIHLVWATRQEAFIQHVFVEDLEPVLHRSDFKASFYVTSGVKQDPPTEEGLFHNSVNTRAEQSLNIIQGRPDLRSIISSHAQEARLSGSSAAVMVCGPPAMADETRSAVHSMMRQGYKRIRYIEESFSW